VRADAVRLEDVYEEDGARLWKAVYLYAADREVASDAVAEAFAQALRRGNDLHAPERWVWRTAFRIAAGELKRRSNEVGSWTDVGYEIPDVMAELLAALPHLSPKQRRDRSPLPLRILAKRGGRDHRVHAVSGRSAST